MFGMAAIAATARMNTQAFVLFVHFLPARRMASSAFA
jgi:hypothetical protein